MCIHNGPVPVLPLGRQWIETWKRLGEQNLRDRNTLSIETTAARGYLARRDPISANFSSGAQRCQVNVGRVCALHAPSCVALRQNSLPVPGCTVRSRH